ncbi:MAG: SDR family oxidoreductase [Nitriliruptorales bacterium]|nr:SDR family oxidoreductase [Nitriliruptorales bacterium]
MTSRPWTRALVTGASTGIGREFVRQLAERGTHVVLVARSEDDLQQLAGQLAEDHGVGTEVLTADLTQRNDLERVETRLRDEDEPVDLLVNNAGFGTGGQFDELDLDREVSEIRLNVLAVTRLTHAALGEMTRRGRGGILNVSSNAAWQPVPYMATYGGTKAFVSSFTQAVHEEARGTGVHVTLLEPGFTRTRFQEVADVDASTRQLPDAVWMEPGPVVTAALEGVRKNRGRVVPGWMNKVAGAFSTVSPPVAGRKIAGRVFEGEVRS